MRASFVFSEVVTGLRRNITMTIAMILTTAISLSLLGGGLLTVRLIDKVQAQYYSELEVMVVLTDDLTANDKDCAKELCSSLRENVKKSSIVDTVVFETREEAYQRFQRIFQADRDLLELTRPESLKNSLRVKLKNPERADAVAKEFDGKQGVAKVIDQRNVVAKLNSLFNGFRNLTFAIGLVLALAALLLISNTIQVSAFTRRTEVGIMRLVGATRWYTQLPFLIEAAIAGLAGALLAVVGLVTAKLTFIDDVLADQIKTGVIPALSMADVAYVAPWLLLAGILISSVTGYVTLRLYVRT